MHNPRKTCSIQVKESPVPPVLTQIVIKARIQNGKITFSCDIINENEIRLENAARRAKGLDGLDLLKVYGVGFMEKDESSFYLPAEPVHKFYPGGYCQKFLFKNAFMNSECALDDAWTAVKLPFPDEGTSNIVSDIKGNLPKDI